MRLFAPQRGVPYGEALGKDFASASRVSRHIRFLRT